MIWVYSRPESKQRSTAKAKMANQREDHLVIAWVEIETGQVPNIVHYDGELTPSVGTARGPRSGGFCRARVAEASVPRGCTCHEAD